MSDKKFVSTHKQYFLLSKEGFEEYLRIAKHGPGSTVYSIDCGRFPAFYRRDEAVLALLNELFLLEGRLNVAMATLPHDSLFELLRRTLVDEVLKTNEMERVYSTRKDIFYLLDDFSSSKKEKVSSIVNKYRLLLEGGFKPLSSIDEVREDYDKIMDGALEEDELPDGEVFRAKDVFITDGIRPIHTGLFPEGKIKEAISVVLDILNGDDYSIYEKLAISHFLFEYAHPFYEGNGRMGRYMMSDYALSSLSPIFSFRIATSIELEKNSYYKAFKDTEDIYNRGDLTTFVHPMLEIAKHSYEAILGMIEEGVAKKHRIDAILKSMDFGTEGKILPVLSEATVWGIYGLGKNEIASRASLSHRSVERHLGILKENGLLEITNIGKKTYYRLKEDALAV